MCSVLSIKFTKLFTIDVEYITCFIMRMQYFIRLKKSNYMLNIDKRQNVAIIADKDYTANLDV